MLPLNAMERVSRFTQIMENPDAVSCSNLSQMRPSDFFGSWMSTIQLDDGVVGRRPNISSCGMNDADKRSSILRFVNCFFGAFGGREVLRVEHPRCECLFIRLFFVLDFDYGGSDAVFRNKKRKSINGEDEPFEQR